MLMKIDRDYDSITCEGPQTKQVVGCNQVKLTSIFIQYLVYSESKTQ